MTNFYLKLKYILTNIYLSDFIMEKMYNQNKFAKNESIFRERQNMSQSYLGFDVDYATANKMVPTSNSQRWRLLLLPEVDEKFIEIMRERQLKPKKFNMPS